MANVRIRIAQSIVPSLISNKAAVLTFIMPYTRAGYEVHFTKSINVEIISAFS
jgi:hypothetical protein